jgi:hypothetical protein
MLNVYIDNPHAGDFELWRHQSTSRLLGVVYMIASVCGTLSSHRSLCYQQLFVYANTNFVVVYEV